MSGQGYTNSCYHTPRRLKRKDGQSRAHQLLLLAQVGVLKKERWVARRTPTPTTVPCRPINNNNNKNAKSNDSDRK